MLQDEVMLNGAFGSALAPLGDFNGDGIMDLVVGAPYKDLTGAIYVLYLTRGTSCSRKHARGRGERREKRGEGHHT
jgi:hypothetical protein